MICQVFGPYCQQALAVARCESGLNVWATNGQYVGLFQVSFQWRRSIPGFAMDPWSQARHAYAIFRLMGYSWRPWTCRP